MPVPPGRRAAGRDRVHAILVVRPDGRTPASLHLKRTLAALDASTRQADALTIVVCAEDDLIAEHAAASGAESVVRAPAGTTYAQATRLASLRVDESAHVWLIAQDTAPEPGALALLAGTLELSETVSIAAPKLVRWDDRDEIVSLGVTMTPLGRRVALAQGEYDQGQHDGDEDALGADVRGLLVRAGAWRRLGGLDPALAGADEGLDLGVRARLAGGRVALVPAARVAVAGDGAAGLPDPTAPRRVRHAGYARRRAQLHRRLAYAHPVALPFLWLAILPLAVLRTIGHLVSKAPGLIAPEWGASVTAFVRLDSVAAARRRIGAHRTTSWQQLDELRLHRAALRRRLDTVDPDAGERRRGELRFFSGGGAWVVLAALVASIVAFTPLLAWPVLGGGGLLPLSDSVAQLWQNAGWGLRATGVGEVGPADPFAAVLAVLGSLWPANPSAVLVLLWVLALPLAVLGGWFAATRLTDRSSLRIVGGVAWALAPTFVTALMQGRPAAVIAHLLLPWLLCAGAVAHRSWVAAAAASLLFAGTLAAAPSLAPALMVLWVLAIVLAATMRSGHGMMRIIWVAIPAVALAGPLVWRQVSTGGPLALLADPGLTWAGPQVAADAAGRGALATGFPTADLGGWATLLGDAAALWWVPLLLAPVALLALLAPLTRRWATGWVLLGIAVVGLATAFAAVGISVAADQSQPVALWPGAGLSLAWLGVTGAALTTMDAGLADGDRRLRAVRPVAVAIVLVVVGIVAAPSLSALHRDEAMLTDGPRTTLPAYVAAEGRTDPDVGTLVITPQSDGSVAAQVVWGQSETLDGQSTLLATRVSPNAADELIAALTADLIASSAPGVVEQLTDAGVAFVLLAPSAEPESIPARTTRLRAVTAIDQREHLDAVGTTSRGLLWRAVEPSADRAGMDAEQRSISRWIAVGQLAMFAVAVLLALPTAASRRAARLTPRTVGQGTREDP
ncbi:MAG TPA: glycosyltransferase [Microbacterium sp.]|nr:glycosyltransferase [Microbacterium sp.]